MNKWILTGTVFKEPEVKVVGKDTLLCDIMVSVGRGYKDKETGKYIYDIFRLKAFSATADYIHKYIRNGDSVELDITVNNNNYEKDGKKVYSNQYIVKDIKHSPKKRVEKLPVDGIVIDDIFNNFSTEKIDDEVPF